ncbi:MAG TPA: hypothetical protein DD638_01660, partial [Pasteurellaceae bacterium]|nr:hypothetical protein [Pasteurellaceae bacterium]
MEKFTKKLTLIAMLVILNACVTTSVNMKSNVDMPTQFEQTQQATGSAEITYWWRNWNDPQLSNLIEQGLQHNLD